METKWLRDWQYICTEEEIYRCLKRSGLRKAGPLRLGIQTGVLLLLTVYCLIGFFADGMTDWRALFVAVAAAVLAVILLVVPDKRFHYEAAREAELQRKLHVFLFENGLAFGTPEEVLPFSACCPRLYEDMAVLRFQGGAFMAVPRRAMNEEDWQLFIEIIRPKAEIGR